MSCYIIAEVGPNHDGQINKALKFIKALSKTGCDAIKFQHGNPSDIYSNQSFFPDYQIKLKEKYQDPMKAAKQRLLKDTDHIKLFKECKKNNIDYLCSAFDINSIKFLNQNTNMKYFKIPSGEILSLDILEYIRKFDKPIILSTGMATDEEIEYTINFLNYKKKKDITLLHCISSYPTKDKDINLARISYLKEKYKTKVGISDHTISNDVASYSIFLDAKIIEKHVTFNKKDIGPDHKTSLEIQEFIKMVKKVRKAELIYGSKKRIFKSSEKNVKSASRKSLTAKKNIIKGENITKSKISFKRPGTGISPIYLDKIINKKARKDILKNDLILIDDIK